MNNKGNTDGGSQPTSPLFLLFFFPTTILKTENMSTYFSLGTVKWQRRKDNRYEKTKLVLTHIVILFQYTNLPFPFGFFSTIVISIQRHLQNGHSIESLFVAILVHTFVPS